MKAKNKKSITTRIFYAFIVLLLLYIFHAFLFFHAMNGISNLTKIIHNHPLVVSNASLQANANILKMHRNMKDVVIVNDEAMIISTLEKVDMIEKETIKNLQIVQQNILGAEGQALASEALVMFLEWRSIRESVIANVKKGEKAIAAKTTWTEGAAHVEQLEQKMSALLSYARKKATGFLQDADTVYQEFKTLSVFLLPGWIIMFLGVALFTVKKTYQAERALSEEKELLKITLRSIGDGVIATDRNAKITMLNEVAENLTGWKEADAIGHKIEEVFTIINEITRVPCENPVGMALKKNGVVGLANHTVLISKDGGEVAIADSGAPIRNSDQDIIGVVLVFRDQTEEKAFQNELLRSEKKYRLLSENTLDAIWTMNLNYQFTYTNKAVISFFGYTQDEWVGSLLSDHCKLENLELAKNCLQRLLSKKDEDAGILFEIEMLQKNGARINVEIRSRVVFDKENNPIGFQGVTRDISERKVAEQSRVLLEKQLYQAQKMESVGRLAGGVAHDFNNMLNVILGYTDIALKEMEENSSLYNDLLEVKNAASRSTEITRQLLAFARKQTIAPVALDLNEKIKTTLKMLGRIIGEDIELSWVPGQNIYSIMIDPTQVDQVLANLCVNSRDAISGIGNITIETGNISLDERYCKNHIGFRPGDFVYLIISDDGCGMDNETQENAFEPFFTTKGVGCGTGLGLATVYGIVKQNHGFVYIYSEHGKGTAVKIYLPRYIGEKANESKPIMEESPLGKGETILLVEDEPAILKLCKRILVLLGYAVLDAGSPRKALDIVDQYDGTINLILTDVVMPGMNGKQLAETIELKHSGIKVLYMSGYTSNAIAHRGVLDDDIRFIQKPFSQADIAVKIREILDE